MKDLRIGGFWITPNFSTSIHTISTRFPQRGMSGNPLMMRVSVYFPTGSAALAICINMIYTKYLTLPRRARERRASAARGFLRVQLQAHC